jgi:serine/threonine-protein kinase
VTIVGERGREEIALLPTDGNGPMRVLPTSDLLFKSAGRWSPDGRTLVITQIVPGSDRDLFTIDAERGGAPRPLANEAASLSQDATISPDGRWLAYDTEVAGRRQVFVRRFPDGGGRVQITTAGGVLPRWVRGGREIVYLGNDRRSFFSIAFVPGQEPGPAAPRLLFQIPPEMSPFGWDVTKDGERFLLVAVDAPAGAASTTVIVDWPALLRKG